MCVCDCTVAHESHEVKVDYTACETPDSLSCVGWHASENAGSLEHEVVESECTHHCYDCTLPCDSVKAR